ncbi:hypothetical protein JHD47_03350 [Sulfurimonas sp. SAG-AH-194-L11]|nr:SAF domain-containing protein [Sulfurimonas sp. SAG-AH-194-L11]MDF1876849.1 hypothetical protein [Sulfurimonas sp. SAG-AH-194-L11]
MRNRQTRIIMGILVGLVLFSSSIALLMYSKQDSLSEYVEGHIEVYVATKHLNKGDLISSEDIDKAYLPKSYIAFTPLTQSEIIGRYAKVEIFAKEPLRKEKISLTKPNEEPIVSKQLVREKVKVKVLKTKKLKKDTITVTLSLFQNIDASLKQGDYIDILSVIPKISKGKTSRYDTKYVALKVKIHSFVSNYKQVKRYITSDIDGKSLTADSIIFEMSPNEIKNFLSVYYKTQELNSNRVFNSKKSNEGHLWMVKCSTNEDDKQQKMKNKMLVDHKTTYRKRVAKRDKVSISYED